MPLSFAPVSAAPVATAPEVIHDELHFGGYLRPPEVPPDPTGEGWRGPQGIPGVPGQDGADGDPGQDGMDGTDGISITAGAGAPAGAPPSGTLYIDSVTGDLWQYT